MKLLWTNSSSNMNKENNKTSLILSIWAVWYEFPNNNFIDFSPNVPSINISVYFQMNHYLNIPTQFPIRISHCIPDQSPAATHNYTTHINIHGVLLLPSSASTQPQLNLRLRLDLFSDKSSHPATQPYVQNSSEYDLNTSSRLHQDWLSSVSTQF